MDRATLQLWIGIAVEIVLFFAALLVNLPGWLEAAGLIAGMALLLFLVRGYRAANAEPSVAPPTSTLFGTRVGRLDARIESSADHVAQESEVDEWTGDVRHNPGPKDRPS